MWCPHDVDPMRADGTPDVWMKANTDFSDLTDWLALKREGSASYEAEILQIYSNLTKTEITLPDI